MRDSQSQVDWRKALTVNSVTETTPTNRMRRTWMGAAASQDHSGRRMLSESVVFAIVLFAGGYLNFW